MNATTEIKKGRFGRPIVQETASKTASKGAIKKGFFIFKLIEEQTLSKPVDKKTGETVGDPYPALYIAPNSGEAVNPQTGEKEPWRYLHGYSSIWVKNQEKPEPSKERLGNIDGKNDLVFRTGKIKVMAHETAKYEALTVQDIYDGIGDRQINEVPFKYTLVDPAKEQTKLRNAADEAFEAEKLAREASTEEMLGVAMAFGIDVQNSDMEEDSIRTKFILKAKSEPKLFMRVFNDPRVKIKFLVTKYLSEGLITVMEGVLSYNGNGMLAVRMDADIAEQVATMALEGEEKAIQLYETLKSLT